MQANHWSPKGISKILLSLLLFSFIAQIHGRALATRRSSVAARGEDHIPQTLNSSDPFGERSRHHPVWNSSTVSGDKDRVPPVWNSTTVPGEGGPWRHAEDEQHVPPRLNSSNPFEGKGRHHPAWNSSMVPGDKDRTPPLWNSTNVPGEDGPWRHAGPGNGVHHQHAPSPGPHVPGNTTTLE